MNNEFKQISTGLKPPVLICNKLKRMRNLNAFLSIVDKDCNSCQNMSCMVDSSEKIGLDEDGKSQGYNCIGYINHNIDKRAKIKVIKSR